MKIINLTPHDICYHAPDGTITTYHSSGIARVDTITRAIPTSDDMPLLQTTSYQGVTGLPSQRNDTLLIVSFLVQQALPDRLDLISPATGPNDQCIRNNTGQVAGVTRFNQNQNRKD